MVRSRLHPLLAVALVALVAAAGLTGCEQPLIIATVPDTSVWPDGRLDVPSYVPRVGVLEDGTVYAFDYNTTKLARFDATLKPLAGWTTPTFAGYPTYIGQALDGSIVVVVAEGGVGKAVRLDAAGQRIASATRTLLSTNYPAIGRSPFGALAVLQATCAPNTACDTFTVVHLTPGGDLRYELTVSFAGVGDTACNGAVNQAMAHDDGSTTVLVPRCNPAGSTQTSVATRRIEPGGTIDASYGGGDGVGTLSGGSGSPVINDGGQVLAGYSPMQRLRADGTYDTTFGAHDYHEYLSGVSVDTLIADGTGYIAAGLAYTSGCAQPGKPQLAFIRADGTLALRWTAPVSVSGANLRRFPDGDLVVSGSELTPSGSSCVTPYTFHYLRLTTPPPAGG
jgi:hypothetical protein